MISIAFFPTQNAAKYMQQLCKHFAHKVEATCDDTRGDVALKDGPCVLTAEPDGLRVQVTAAAAKEIIEARFVIDIHLVTFAHRENFTGLTWVMQADAEAL
jgi:hypothetical protein